MKNNFKLLLLSALALLACVSARGEDALTTLLASKAIDPDRTAVYVWDLQSDCRIAGHNTKLPLTPASVMKCVTTAALCDRLPYNFTYETKVYLEGEQIDSIFRGKLLVVGSGDPSLGENRYEGHPSFPEEIAKKLDAKGIKRLEAEVTVDDALFAGPAVPPSWDKADLDKSYGTGFHSFNYGGNRSGKAAVSNPLTLFKTALEKACNEKGITITELQTAPTSKRKTHLLTYQSPYIADIMASCMYRSDNLYAEALLRKFGMICGGDGSTASAASAATRYWESANFPIDDVVIVDGSGLSRSNCLTAEFLGEVLKDMEDDPTYVSFFPLTGEEGTVRHFLEGSPLQAYMALKTGSMNGIQSYAGYVVDDDFQPTHAVVVIANGLKNRTKFREDLARFFISLFPGHRD